MSVENVLSRIIEIEHGFQHIIDGTNEILSSNSKEQCFKYAITLLEHKAYQARMLATSILGKLATTDKKALYFLKEQVSIDKNWRVQEMLAKAFDEICKYKGYESSLPLIEEWINDNNPNVVRAVTEGLRIWTNRPFFKENPMIAIALVSKHKEDESEYLRKSVGNALKDISKKYPDLIQQEVIQWDLSNPRIFFTYKLTTKILK